MIVDPEEKLAINAAEANAARARVGAIIDQMLARISPERLLDDAASAAKEHAGQRLEAARTTLQRYPFAVGFLGAAVGLIAARRLTDDK